MEAIRTAGGVGVPTIKPWNQELVFEKLDLARTSGCKAVAMDIDGAGLPFLKNMTPPAGSKSVQELAEIIRYAGMPFIVKGVMTVRGAQKAADTVVELCRTRLPNNMKIPPSDIQVLTPTRKYDTGMEALNVRLQAALNPPSPEKKERRFGETVFREGDRVMQIRNDYDIALKNPDGTTAGTGVYNGDVGQITAIDPQTETLAVCYDGKTATYGFEMLNELEHAWS